MLKSLQSTKSMGLKDLLQCSYLSLLTSVTESAFYFLHFCSDPSPSPLNISVSEDASTSFSEHCLDFSTLKEREELPQKFSSLRPSFPSSVLNKRSVSICSVFIIKLCNVWRLWNESQYNSIIEQRQEGDWEGKQGENGIISKLNETASFHFFS